MKRIFYRSVVGVYVDFNAIENNAKELGMRDSEMGKITRAIRKRNQELVREHIQAN